MPEYLYRCPICTKQFTTYRTFQQIESGLYPAMCPDCPEVEAVKVFTMPNINWGGLRPSQGEISPQVKDMIDDAPRRRDNEKPHQSNRLARLNEEVKRHGLS